MGGKLGCCWLYGRSGCARDGAACWDGNGLGFVEVVMRRRKLMGSCLVSVYWSFLKMAVRDGIGAGPPG